MFTNQKSGRHEPLPQPGQARLAGKLSSNDDGGGLGDNSGGGSPGHGDFELDRLQEAEMSAANGRAGNDAMCMQMYDLATAASIHHHHHQQQQHHPGPSGLCSSGALDLFENTEILTTTSSSLYDDHSSSNCQLVGPTSSSYST